MPRPASRVPLCQEMGRIRSDVGKARRVLPKPGPNQTSQDAKAAYWLERATWCLLQAEQAWDDPQPDPRFQGAPDAP